MNGANANSSNNNNSDDSIIDVECLGSKKVRLRRLGSSWSSPISTVDTQNGNNDALLAIYMVKFKNDNNNSGNEEIGQKIPFYLRLWITHDSETFEARLLPSDAKLNVIHHLKQDPSYEESQNYDELAIESVVHQWSSSDNFKTELKILQTISDSILNDRSNFTVSYVLIHHKRPNKRTNHTNNNTNIDSKVTTIQMTIRQELKNGQFLKLWKGMLRKKTKQEIEHTNTKKKEEKILIKDDKKSHHGIRNHNHNNDTSLEFSLSLSQSLKKAQSEITKLKKEKEQIMLQVTKWKDTALKLETAWDQEKTELFENFLTLYNRVKGELRKTRNELKEQKLKNPSIVGFSNKLKRPSNTVVNTSSPSKQQNNDIIDHVEEHDVLHFDPDEVDRLATSTSSNPITISTDVNTFLSQEGNDAMNWSQTSTVHKNIYTGATEIFLDTNDNESNNEGTILQRTKKRKRLNNNIAWNSAYAEATNDENDDENLLLKPSFILHDGIKREESMQKNNNNDVQVKEDDCSSVESSECGSEPLL